MTLPKEPRELNNIGALGSGGIRVRYPLIGVFTYIINTITHPKQGARLTTQCSGFRVFISYNLKDPNGLEVIDIGV